MASLKSRVLSSVIKGVFRDERGMTSVGMAIAMMISLALVFSCAQAYKVSTASSEIQEVADACALAAENEVAEFMIAVKTCDAAVLSLTLLSALSYGLGVVAACVPPLAPVSVNLIDFGTKISTAKDRFSKAAANGLNALQKVLPFLAAASSLSVAKANEGNSAMDASYHALSVLVPFEGKPIGQLSNDGLERLGSEVEGSAQEIRDAAEKAEQLAQKANDQKLRAYQHDCGYYPSYCQYQRAATLSGISAYDNPYYSNVDTWSFSAALERAQRYYTIRSATEQCPSTTVSDKASYHIRMKFYAYAKELLATGYVHDDGNAFDAYFPKLPRNIQEMRSTSLWTEAMFPITGDANGTSGIMHAYSGCPAAGNVIGHDNVKALEAEIYIGCEVCGFVPESLGNVASASTNIQNGFEHHYEQIRQAAEEYENARKLLDPLRSEIEGKVDPILDALRELLSGLGSQRIHATPPGSAGVIAIVLNTSVNSSDTGFESMFVTPGQLGVRGAVSAAALVEDTGHDASNVITSLLDGLDGGIGTGAARIVLDCWSSLLEAYASGQRSLKEAVAHGIGLLSLGTASGLGDWAAGIVDDAFSMAGLEPANLKALKPALLNTEHVSSAGTDAFSVTFSKVKSSALSMSSPSTDPLAGIASAISGRAFDSPWTQTLTVAEIEFPIGGAKLPIELVLPPSIAQSSESAIEGCKNAISKVTGGVFEGSSWQ